MALSVCLACSTVYAVGLARCPHCQSPDFAEQGTMPKITRSGGPSHEVDEFTDAHGTTWRNAKDFTEEEPSPGNSSSTSAEKQQPSETPSETGRQQPAPTTANRSKRGRKGNSTADTTDGPTTAADQR